MAGDEGYLSLVSDGLIGGRNGWTEVAAPEGRKEKGGRVREEEERPNM